MMKMMMMITLVSVTQQLKRVIPAINSFVIVVHTKSTTSSRMISTTATTFAQQQIQRQPPPPRNLPLQVTSYRQRRMIVPAVSLTSFPQEENRRQLSSSSSSSPPNSFARTGLQYPRRTADAFKEGQYILARSEGNSDNSSDNEEFNLFEGIAEEVVEFRMGLPIVVEVISFGPLGASVAVIGKDSHDVRTMKLTDKSNPLAIGLIYQREIEYYRESRQKIDIVLGEILPAYVEWVRADGKIDVALRVLGGRAKVNKWSDTILERLEELGMIPVGQKSTPLEISREFPGMSKLDFKKCCGALFRRQLLFPFNYCVMTYDKGLIVAQQEQAEGIDESGVVDFDSDSDDRSDNNNNDDSDQNTSSSVSGSSSSSSSSSSGSYNSSSDNTNNSDYNQNSNRRKYEYNDKNNNNNNNNNK